MWLYIKTSVFVAMFAMVTCFASVSPAAINCTDLPNVYTVEDLNAIKDACEDAPVLGSTIYPSATWIFHAYLYKLDDFYGNWVIESTPGKKLIQICIIFLGGGGNGGDATFKSVSGHCGNSYPIDYADLHNFVEIGTGTTGTTDESIQPIEHFLVQNGKEVKSSDHYVLYAESTQCGESRDASKGIAVSRKEDRQFFEHKYEVEVFKENADLKGAKMDMCSAFCVRDSDMLKTCSNVVGPLVYNGSFYGMNETEKDLRPYHHGCFTVENFGADLTSLDFLEKIVTDSDYVDRCIGKFANVIKAPKFCPNPRRYYASMDPDPEGEVRTAFIKSENNVKGKLEVKVEFPNDANITYDCVHECSGDINQSDNTSPSGLYSFSCRYLNGTVTLTKPGWKGSKDPDTIVLEHIERIIGQLKINAEVGYKVLPSLEIVDGSAMNGPALELYFTDVNDDEPSFPMQLTKVIAKDSPAIVLHHGMPKDKIPPMLIEHLKRLVADPKMIRYKPIAGTSPNTFF